MIAAANQHARELQDVINVQVEEHSRDLVAQGAGRAVATGEKARMTSKDHDTLSLLNDGNGARAVSFAKRSVPEIAVSMDARDEFIQLTAVSIKKYFSEH